MKCSVPGCPDESRARGYCPLHYQRKRRTGTTDRRVYLCNVGVTRADFKARQQAKAALPQDIKDAYGF